MKNNYDAVISIVLRKVRKSEKANQFRLKKLPVPLAKPGKI